MRKNAAKLILAVCAAGILCMPASAATKLTCRYHPKARVLVRTKQATCSAKASRTYLCGTCGKALKMETFGSKKNHTPGKMTCQIVVNGAFTKTKGKFNGAATHVTKCKKCGAKYEVGSAKFSYETKGTNFVFSKAVGSNMAAIARKTGSGTTNTINSGVYNSFIYSIHRRISPRAIALKKNKTYGRVYAELTATTTNGISYGRALSGTVNAAVYVK